MNPKIDELMSRIHELQAELEADLEQKRGEFRYHLENRRARFEQDMLALHHRLRKGSLRYLAEAPFLFILTAPVIYGAVFPMLLLDLTVTVYQAICFTVYKIPKVRRTDHFVYDRHLLSYLNWIERMNCLYCSYGNGLMSYAREVVARTEQFWCPIKHARGVANSHDRYARFFDYGDAERYRAELEQIRKRYSDDQASLT
ncbi:MAG: hypothetical protein P4L70_03380 [Parasulfuritortus sp.]|jgi:hypothetical protein|nr:hypothetical protein [Parasulfuritortus sp.]